MDARHANPSSNGEGHVDEAPDGVDEAALDIARRCHGEAARVEPIAGVRRTVFRIRTPGVDRILKLGAAADVRKELMLLDRLQGTDVPVPEVERADPDGDMAGRPFFIMPSAGDHTIADRLARTDQGNLARLFADMGTTLARIHHIAWPSAGRITHDDTIAIDVAARRSALDASARRLVEAGLLDAREATGFHAHDMPALDGRSLCHGDFHAVQCVLSGNRIAAVVDWHSAWAGSALLDLAMTHAYLDYYGRPEHVRAFLQAYDAACPLPDAYAAEGLVPRMALALRLGALCLQRGRDGHARRAIVLYRRYARDLERGPRPAPAHERRSRQHGRSAAPPPRG